MEDVRRPEGVCEPRRQFIAMPLAAIGNAVCYRESHMKAAGFSEFPKDTAGFLELCKALKAKGTPAGFPHGKAVGDGNNYAHWLLWSHGGTMVDESGKVTINSPETLAAVNYAKSLYETFIPRHRKLARHQQQPRLPCGPGIADGKRRLALLCGQEDAALASLRPTSARPTSPSVRSARASNSTRRARSCFQDSKYPEAAKAYLKFMMEADQMNAWIEGSSAYCCQPLKALPTTRSGPRTRSTRPMRAPRRRCGRTATPDRSAMPRQA